MGKIKRFQPGLAALGVTAGGLSFVRVEREGARPPRILAHSYRPLAAGDSIETLLGQMAREHYLKRSHCTTVLGDADYQLLLTEAPDVPAEELRAAVRWRIKDLIDFHINDAALDVFDVPGQQGTAATQEMYVVAARARSIQSRVDLLEAAGINLEIIDIPELAQRNIAALLPEDAQGVAMLSFDDRGGLITVTRQGFLYLSRTLATSAADLENPQSRAAHFDQVVLEVQRSLDYYESHFRQAPVRSLVLSPPGFDSAELVSYLGANLNATVRVLDVSQLVENGADLPGTCLMTLGAALRQEVKAL